MYCTEAEVRAAAADGALDGRDPADITAAALDAAAWVDRYAGRHFGTLTGSLVLRSDALGRIFLPVAPLDDDGANIESVSLRERPSQPLPDAAWQWLPGVRGEESVIVLGGPGTGPNLLVVGQEPWRGRCTNTYARVAEYVVVGSFGQPGVPQGVRTASAMLAAWMLGAPLAGADTSTTPGLDDLANVRSLSVEGYSVTFGVVAPPSAGVDVHTTGLTSVDRLLAPYRRRQRTWNLG